MIGNKQSPDREKDPSASANNSKMSTLRGHAGASNISNGLDTSQRRAAAAKKSTIGPANSAAFSVNDRKKYK